MERVETLIKKMQDQFAAKAPADQLLLTVQMLQAELVHLQKHSNAIYSAVAVDIPQTILPPVSSTPDPVTEEKIVEILQVDEAEIEAELEEIKRNAEAVQKMSVHNKPALLIEEEEHPLPTLAQHLPPPAAVVKKEINDVIADAGASLNDRLKEAKTDLAGTLTDTPVRDLKKAIGINDRFLYINELFRGDETMYERSIKTINGFSILPEAEYWMQRELKVKLGWSDGNETVQQFTQLVRRRFS
jgi:hypothetical protein